MIAEVKNQGRITAVSLTEIGDNHKKIRLPNQDAICIDVVGEDFVIAVSDGVGSCKKSEAGAKAAVSISAKIFKESKEGTLAKESRIIIEEIIKRWQKEFGNDCNDYCATLKIAMKLGKKVLLFSLGDGFVAVTSKGMKIISPTENGTFANETKCLDSKIKVEDFWTGYLDLDINLSYTVIACTDGVANGIKEGGELSFVEEIECNVPGEELEHELTDFIADISKYCFDDKTLGVVKYER